MLRIFTYRESGVALLETVVALAIVGTIAVTFLTGLITTTRAAFTVDERATAMSLARSQIEWAQSASYNVTRYYSPGPMPTDTDYSDYSANITAQSLPDGNVDIQKITVTVNRSDEQVFILESYKVYR